MDSIDFWAQRVRELETATEREQNRVLGGELIAATLFDSLHLLRRSRPIIANKANTGGLHLFSTVLEHDASVHH